MEETEHNNDYAAAPPVEFSLVEARVIGCLMEKEKTTPDNYPLTLNALTNACNQKTSRDPVMSLDEEDVALTLESLQKAGWVTVVNSAGSRVPKYKHRMTIIDQWSDECAAVLTVLMLRGPQTLGEVKERCSRLYQFGSLQEVESHLHDGNSASSKLVVQLPREHGRKDGRYMHILCGMPQVEAEQTQERVEPVLQRVRDEQQRIEHLENEVAGLKNEIAELRREFSAFRHQFD